MPEVLEVRPKGIYVKIEISLDELIKIKTAMEKSVITVDMKNEEEKEIRDYYTEIFYPFIEKIVKDLSDGT